MKRIKSKNQQVALRMVRICHLYTAYWTKVALNHVIPKYDMTAHPVPRKDLKRARKASVRYDLIAFVTTLLHFCLSDT